MSDEQRMTNDERLADKMFHSSLGIRHSSASAPAKLILCGEHAVVYGRPAIALPLIDIRAHAEVSSGVPGSGIVFDARDLGRCWALADAPDDPLSMLVTSTLDYLARATHHASRITHHALRITIISDIPIASGMGSGAAVATALVRALMQHADLSMPNEQVSALVYESERRLHGTPSGIDNAVVAYEMPVWFQRTNDEQSESQASSIKHQANINPAAIAVPFTLLVADTGVRSATKLPVGAVRQGWQSDPARYKTLFDRVGALVAHAREVLARGDVAALGLLLNENHAVLQQIGVSSPELDHLVHAAQDAGAVGAKLSGAGWGGVMLALVQPETQAAVAAALRAAGAARVLVTEITATA